MNNWFKKNSIHLGILGLFLAICFIYFSPVIQGKALQQADVIQAKAMQKEIMDFKEKDGKAPLWTNGMFGGMPAYQIWAQYPNNITTYVISFFKTVFPNPVESVFLYLAGAYLLFCVLGLSPWLAAAGAIAFAFTSYNFILIDAGHSNKALALGFFAPILAGIILTFRGKYLLGAALTALFLAVEIRSNHIQMTYYLMLAILIFVGIELYHAIKNKQTAGFLKSMLYLGVAALLSIAVNAGTLWTTFEYGQESIRGKAILSGSKTGGKSGLDKEYAYQWSQGVGETLTFLIPNAYGGGSQPILDEKSEVAKAILAKGAPADQAVGFAQQMPVYWGNKPGTGGPWYFGAFVVFLFVFGLFVVKSRLKWWLLSATILSILLSFGKNFPLVSDLFFDYLPFYSKFRAVESTLVIASLCVPILAFLAVFELNKNDKERNAFYLKSLKLTVYIVGGLLVLLAIAPALLLSFKAENHQEFITQLTQAIGGDNNFANQIAAALVKDRESLFRTDAFRSIIIVFIGAGLLWAIISKKIKTEYAYMAIAFLVLFDLWQVDKRYLNDSKFTNKSTLTNYYQPREIDTFIMQDKDLNYRVLDLTIPTFTSADASYFHKTVGGAHTARLRRIDDVINKQFNNSINQDVLDMLNTKYFITQNKDGQNVGMQRNPTACGNAWFVNSVQFVKNADEEMQAISSFDPKKEAIINDEFKSEIDKKKTGVSKNSFIRLTSYKPDDLKYEYSSGVDVLAVFSEIWYPHGWKLYVDDKETPYFRANYLLRAAQLPGGNHKLEWKFEPQSYYTGEIISLIASVLLIGGLGFAFWQENRKHKPVSKAA